MLFNPRDALKRWSLARDKYTYPQKTVPMDELVSYDCPTPLWSFDSLIPAELGDERNFITRVHNWVASLDTKGDKPDVINIWINSIVKGTAPEANICSRDNPNGYLVDWETVDSKKGLAKLLLLVIHAKRALLKAFDLYATKGVDMRDRPKVKAPTIFSPTLAKFQKTIRHNMEANLVPSYHTDKLKLCNQDFNQIMIDFDIALSESN